MPPPARLTDDEIATALTTLEGWQREGDQIVRSFEFTNFSEAFGFLARVALLQEQANHHVETWGVYNQVRLMLSTHDSGGITERDIDLATQVNALLT